MERETERELYGCQTVLLEGHSRDCQFSVRCQTNSLWARLCQQKLVTWQARAVQGTWQYAVQTQFKDLGWIIKSCT